MCPRTGGTDFIGGRGESVAHTRLTRLCRADDPPYFGPHHLGEKCPTFDVLVEPVEAGERTPFFFVQVKASREGHPRTRSPPRLRAGVSSADVRRVSGADVRRVSAFPAPTSAAGVREKDERAFVVSVHGDMREAIPSITTGHELTCDTLRLPRDGGRSSGRPATRPGPGRGPRTAVPP